jgi:hypothetical protein
LTTVGDPPLLAYADDVNLLGDNMNTVKKIKEALIDASEEVGQDISIAKTLYCASHCKSILWHKKCVKVEIF